MRYLDEYFLHDSEGWIMIRSIGNTNGYMQKILRGISLFFVFIGFSLSFSPNPERVTSDVESHHPLVQNSHLYQERFEYQDSHSLVDLPADSQVMDECEPLGWNPSEFGLKDHSIFIFDGIYYLVSIYLPGEKFFAYARSSDLCNWEDLTPVLKYRLSDEDRLAIWAPFVFEENDVYYMFYTGVKGPYPNLTQSIMLATSTNPADPDSWQQHGMVFQPDHSNMIWEDGKWADCRDPMVIKAGETYYLYYTGRDKDGGIIGVARSNSLMGGWEDMGSTLTMTGQLNFEFVNSVQSVVPESPVVYYQQGYYYLFYNSDGEHYRIGGSPIGPWSTEYTITPGWAHEVWLGIDGRTYTSYLPYDSSGIGYPIIISVLSWDDFFDPLHPFIGEERFHTLLPLLNR